MTNWRREDVSLGDRFAHDDHSTIYEVIAIVERPMVVLRPVSALGRGAIGGQVDIHQVIDSDTFSFWKKVSLEGPTR